MLEPGSRIWVNIPGEGYVGVGEVLEAAIPVDEFHVTDNVGNSVPILEVAEKAREMHKAVENVETAEYLVRVKWLKTVPVSQAVKERGFFGNQNTVAKPKTPKWNHTFERLKKRSDIP